MARCGRVGWTLLLLAFVIASCRAPLPTATARPTASPDSQIPPTPGSATVPEPTAALEPAPRATATSVGSTQLQEAFAAAAREFGVPESILLAVSFDETRWEQHNGEPSTDGGYGVMHLTDVPPAPGAGGTSSEPDASGQIAGHVSSRHTLPAAAAMLGVSTDVLKADPTQNVRGGAALLARYARDTVGSTPTTPADWYGAVAKYLGSSDGAAARAFADTVFNTIVHGASRVTADGELVTLAAEVVTPNRATAELLQVSAPVSFAAECPTTVTCNVYPAGPGHTNLANRPADGIGIRYIVIHDTEARYDGLVRVFQAPGGITSAHYLVRSSDGLIAQFVPTKDIARHAGNWWINSHSIGIEHEGYALQGATWFSEPLYQASAKLVRYLAEKYNIPLDRAHIIGHDNVSGQSPSAQRSMHWDPGPFWDWAHYMDLLGAPLGSTGKATRGVVTIDPPFATNQPPVMPCSRLTSCLDLPKQGASFVYLRSAPRADAPLIADPTLLQPGSTSRTGTTAASDWGDKAATGESFYQVNRQGDWTAIYYGGQEAWFFNPANAPVAVPGTGTLVRPKPGSSSVAVYGDAYPEASAYPPGAKVPPVNPLPYTIAPGQIYVATDKITSDFARPLGGLAGAGTAPVVRGQDSYYQIFFNHRLGFVKAGDVEVVTS